MRSSIGGPGGPGAIGPQQGVDKAAAKEHTPMSQAMKMYNRPSPENLMRSTENADKLAGEMGMTLKGASLNNIS